MDSTYDHDALVRRCRARITRDLTPRRAEHTRNVAKEAARLAQKYGADVQKAEIAGLLHDIARDLPQEKMNDYVLELGLDERYLNNKNLAHSKVGVHIIKQDFGIQDRELLDAVSYHTTGREGMTLLEKILFLADATEPGRSYPGVRKLRKLAEEDLDKACALSLRRTKDYIEAKGEYLDPDTSEALGYLEREIIENERRKKKG